MVYVTESTRPTNKRRKRKGAAQNAPGNAGGGPGGPGTPGTAGGKKRSPGPNFSLASQVRKQRYGADNQIIFLK